MKPIKVNKHCYYFNYKFIDITIDFKDWAIPLRIDGSMSDIFTVQILFVSIDFILDFNYLIHGK